VTDITRAAVTRNVIVSALFHFFIRTPMCSIFRPAGNAGLLFFSLVGQRHGKEDPRNFLALADFFLLDIPPRFAPLLPIPINDLIFLLCSATVGLPSDPQSSFPSLLVFTFLFLFLLSEEIVLLSFMKFGLPRSILAPFLKLRRDDSGTPSLLFLSSDLSFVPYKSG